MAGASRLTRLERNWSEWARRDPLFAVLTVPGKAHRRWNVAEFFETGRAEIHAVLTQAADRQLDVNHSLALDFGCGVGRLTQALAECFDRAVGVDISVVMIDAALSYNRYPATCRYVVNEADDLGIFESSSFDFIYSSLVLQHIHPEVGLRYVAEFIRLLTPGGLLVFQVPIERLPPSPREMAINSIKEPVRWTTNVLSQLAVNRPLFPKMEMHLYARDDVFSAVRSASGSLVSEVALALGLPNWRTVRFFVRRDAGTATLRR